MNGIIILDKPAGLSSRRCVDRLIGITGERKAGHAGTLDPFATGLLPVCFGKATRLVEYMRGTKKTYVAGLRLDVISDTLDITGMVTPVASPIEPQSRESVRSILDGFTGEQHQRVPDYSARKIHGRRSYRLVRAGQTIPEKRKRVTVYEMKLLGYRHPVLEFEVTCSEGTYIRMLGADIGERMGTGGVLEDLRRIRIGPIGLEHARSLDDIEKAWSEGRSGEVVHPSETAVKTLARAILSLDGEKIFRHGGTVPEKDCMQLPENLAPDEPVAVFDVRERFMGIGAVHRADRNFGRILKTRKLLDIQH